MGSWSAASAALSRTAAAVVAVAKLPPGGWAPPEVVRVIVTASAAASVAERAPVRASRRRGQACRVGEIWRVGSRAAARSATTS